MKKLWKKCLVLFLCFCVMWSAGGIGNVYAKSLEEIRQEQLENKKKKDEAESQKNDAQKVVDDLQDEADDLGATYNSYNKRLQSVNRRSRIRKSDRIANASIVSWKRNWLRQRRQRLNSMRG